MGGEMSASARPSFSACSDIHEGHVLFDRATSPLLPKKCLLTAPPTGSRPHRFVVFWPTRRHGNRVETVFGFWPTVLFGYHFCHGNDRLPLLWLMLLLRMKTAVSWRCGGVSLRCRLSVCG
jgi:hypothetical protein